MQADNWDEAAECQQDPGLFVGRFAKGKSLPEISFTDSDDHVDDENSSDNITITRIDTDRYVNVPGCMPQNASSMCNLEQWEDFLNTDLVTLSENYADSFFENNIAIFV